MDRLYAPYAVPFAAGDRQPNPAALPAGWLQGLATDGNPVVGPPPTDFPAYAWNMLSEEVRNVVLAAGITPDGTAWSQLLQAIQTISVQNGTGIGQNPVNIVKIGWTGVGSPGVPAAKLYLTVDQSQEYGLALESWVTTFFTVQAAYAGSNNGFISFPGGIYHEVFTASVPAGGGYQQTNLTLPTAFPTNCLDASISYVGNTPPTAQGSISVQPLSRTQVAVTTNFAGSVSLGVAIKCWGN